MPKLKPWYHVVDPREDLMENRPLDASEFAVHLDHIRRGNAPADYVDPVKFFERTFLTDNLHFLASQVLRRLSGIQLETSAVFNMATQFGGGKSHSLAALMHLASGDESAKSWKGVEALLHRAELTTAPKAAVAVLMGKEFDSISGRGGNGEPLRKTPWGEIAWQLGGAESFEVVRQHEESFIEPKGDVIRQMLPKDRPSLILMDEIISYVSTYRKLGYGAKLYNFLDVLCETARGEKNVAVVVSIPASELEYTDQDAADEARFKKMLDRVGKAILMSADKEMAEIIRRRLFQWHGLSDEGKRTVRAYSDWAIEHAQEISGIDPEHAYKTFESAYPFHPSVLSVFERKWQSLPRFQRTRGVLRLLALWVADLHQKNRTTTGEPLITLGSAPFHNPHFRSALFEQLGTDELETPVTTDILGKDDSHATRLDREADVEIKQQELHRKIATVIFFESNGGQSQARAEATVPEIKAGIGGPEVNLANTDTVLESLSSSCFYLNWDRNRYRFGLSPNLNQILVERRGAVQHKRMDERIRQEIIKVFKKGLERGKKDAFKEVDLHPFPERSNDIPSRPALTIAIMAPEHCFGNSQTLPLLNEIVQSAGTTGRTFKSALIFAVPDAAESMYDAARNYLAWEEISEDEVTKKRFDKPQEAQLVKQLDYAERELSEAVFRTYRHVYLLDKSNQLVHVDLGQITSSSGSIIELIFRPLMRDDLVTESVSPSKIARSWPGALVGWSTKAVRDAFYSSPQLPRLLKADAIQAAITRGVSDGAFGYATKDAEGRLQIGTLKNTLLESDVEISEDVFIVPAAEAQKLREPPRLAMLVLNRSDVSLVSGEQMTFACKAQDQYGQAFEKPALTWTAKGGEIDADGLFTASDNPGLFAVKVSGGGVEAIAEVRIRAAAASTAGGGATQPTGTSVIRWEGDVPPQKWMNFYTKVLTRFAANSELKLRVTFKAPVDSASVESKANEARTGLKELGMEGEIVIE